MSAAPDNLPPVVREIEQIAGWTAALRIVKRWGGTRLYVPERIGEGHPLAQAAGLDAAAKLSRRFAGVHIEIPRAYRALCAERRAQIAARYAAGESAARLAREYGMHHRWIRWVVADARNKRPAAQPAAQRGLFDSAPA